MTVQRQFLVWSAAFFATMLFVYVFSPVIMPFVAGMGLAFALDPIVDWMEKRGVGRLAATLTILVVFVIFLVVVLVALVPVLVKQLRDLFDNLPALLDRLQNLLTPLLNTRIARTLGIDANTIKGSLSGFFSQGVGSAMAMLSSLLYGGRALIDILSLLLITPVVGFYLLYDWDRMLARIDSWLPRRHAPTIRRLSEEIQRAISGFVRGQGLICLFLACWYCAGLQLVGLNFGLTIGLGAGLFSFLPFVGTLLGFVVGLGVAAAQFWPDWFGIAATAAVFITGQFLEGYILQPRLVGGRVGLHPVWLMFALLAAGYLFGFLGLLVAVPVAASIGVLIRYALSRYLESPYYSEPAIEAPPADLRLPPPATDVSPRKTKAR